MKIPRNPFAIQLKADPTKLFYLVYDRTDPTYITCRVESIINDQDVIDEVVNQYAWDGTYSGAGGAMPRFSTK